MSQVSVAAARSADPRQDPKNTSVEATREESVAVRTLEEELMGATLPEASQNVIDQSLRDRLIKGAYGDASEALADLQPFFSELNSLLKKKHQISCI